MITETRHLRDDAIAIWKAGVAVVDARKLVRDVVSVAGDQLTIGDQVFSIRNIERIVLVGFGKASGAMAVGFERALGDSLNSRLPVVGLINVPDDKVMETQVVPVVACRPPGENLPTAGVITSTERIIDFVRTARPNDICVCLISGGGSALLEKPVNSITLDQFREATSFLSSAGASIYELNAVRRAISQVKGGGLASQSGGAPVVSLIVSDVVGDNLEVIASGPTVEPSSATAAIDVLKKFDPDRNGVSEVVWAIVEAGTTTETKFGRDLKVSHFVIGNVETAMLAARQKATELGYKVELDQPSGNEGDAALVGRSVAIQIARATSDARPICQIMGGETTVALCDNAGQGGRNQHLVLSALQAILNFHLDSKSEFCLLSGGTDGEDGNVPVAGALFDSGWIESNSDAGLPPLLDEVTSSLERCDSYGFFRQHDLLFQVPNTFTNVCDLRVVLTCQAP